MFCCTSIFQEKCQGTPRTTVSKTNEGSSRALFWQQPSLQFPIRFLEHLSSEILTPWGSSPSPSHGGRTGPVKTAPESAAAAKESRERWAQGGESFKESFQPRAPPCPNPPSQLAVPRDWILSCYHSTLSPISPPVPKLGQTGNTKEGILSENVTSTPKLGFPLEPFLFYFLSFSVSMYEQSWDF